MCETEIGQHVVQILVGYMMVIMVMIMIRSNFGQQ